MCVEKCGLIFLVRTSDAGLCDRYTRAHLVWKIVLASELRPESALTHVIGESAIFTLPTICLVEIIYLQEKGRISLRHESSIGMLS